MEMTSTEEMRNVAKKLRDKASRDNRELLDKAAEIIEEAARMEEWHRCDTEHPPAYQTLLCYSARCAQAQVGVIQGVTGIFWCISRSGRSADLHGVTHWRYLELPEKNK